MQVTQKMLQLGPLQDFWPLRMFGRAEDAQLLELAKLSRILQAESGCSEARQPGIPLWPLLVAKLHIDAVEEQQWQERLAGEGEIRLQRNQEYHRCTFSGKVTGSGYCEDQPYRNLRSGDNMADNLCMLCEARP